MEAYINEHLVKALHYIAAGNAAGEDGTGRLDLCIQVNVECWTTRTTLNLGHIETFSTVES